MSESIDEMLRKIEKNRAGAPAELDAWANERLIDVRSDILKIEREGAYRRFLIRYIKDEHRKLGDEREEPLCTCANDCALIRGRLPPQIRGADSLHGGIEEYYLSHSGDPVVLDEADEAWRELKAKVLTELQRVWTGLKNREIPEQGPTDRARRFDT